MTMFAKKTLKGRKPKKPIFITDAYLHKNKKPMTRQVSWAFLRERISCLATSYSPRGSRPKYHRRWRA